MPCYHPLQAWRNDYGDVVFAGPTWKYEPLNLACGQCIGCRLEKSRQWATRCMHEAQMHKYNCFITLTYNEANRPPNDSLQYSHFQQFMRRLRKALSRKDGLNTSMLYTERLKVKDLVRGHQLEKAMSNTTRRPVRFYMSGEYGEQYGRPHFHACLFGINFKDKTYLKTTSSGKKIYRSEALTKIWAKGFASVGELTFESAAYTARYIMTKINGKNKDKHYTKINNETGEIYIQTPEFNNMSRASGIGHGWLMKYTQDVYPDGKVIVRGKKSNAPRYYNKQYKKLDPLGYEEMQYGRHIEAIAQAENNTPPRLKTREIVAQAKVKLLKRGKI